MQNLNDPKLTNQERQHILRLSIDKEYRKKYEKAKEHTDYIFQSYWVVQSPDLIKFNDGAYKFEDCWYDFYKERLEEIAPNVDIILLEGDRVEEGEWDTTYERWCPASYQRVLVVNTNGKFHGFEEGAFGDEDASGADAGMLTDYFKADTETSIGRKIAHNYPATFQEDGMPKMPYIAGHLDIPLALLSQYEEQRVREPVWYWSNQYVGTRDRIKQEALEYKAKKEKRKSYRQPKNTTKKLKRAFKGGFGK